jgi:hypothetical protein
MATHLRAEHLVVSESSKGLWSVDPRPARVLAESRLGGKGRH